MENIPELTKTLEAWGREAQADGKNFLVGDLLIRAMAAIHGQQAKIDALMLEYCPDEMTPAQLEEWGRHQRPGRDASAKAKLESAKP